MKYTGSKSRISNELSKLINNLIKDNGIETYIEPFVGGANVIENIVCKNKIGSDNNEYLIELWKSIQNGYVFPDFITREEFYNVKLNIGSYPREYVAVVGICASYNGNWFTSYGGYSDTKTGKDRNYYQESVNNILKQMPKIKDVVFKCSDYSVYSNVNNCLIYCDPPYLSRKDTYKDKQFKHTEFWDWVRKVSKNNIVLVSEYTAPDDLVI